MGNTSWELFRAIRRDSPSFDKLDGVAAGRDGATSDELLYARIEGDIKEGSEGEQYISAADVTLDRVSEDAPWFVATDGGTSMHDVSGWFGYTNWNYFRVPKGTEYSEDVLFIKRDKKNKWNKAKTVKGRHYTIRPKNRMRLDTYLGALDNLARAAVVRSIMTGQPLRVHSAEAAEVEPTTEEEV